MQGNVVLTVVIPNHNYACWLPDAINSVAADPYPFKRIIVVDDGSTDNSWDTICKLGDITNADDPKENMIYTGQVQNTVLCAYRFEKAGGPSRARNLGITALWNQTHLFGFLDADDEYLPGKISKSIATFVESPERIGAIYTDYDTVDINTGRVVRVYKEPFSRERLLQECIVHSACMVNKLALHACGLYDEELRCAEDFDLWLRISEKFLIVHIPEPLMSVRVGSHNSTNVVKKETWNRCLQRVSQKVQERAKAKTNE
jgi:glycosyltransferase involved in cell wall biosynthesis